MGHRPARLALLAWRARFTQIYTDVYFSHTPVKWSFLFLSVRLRGFMNFSSLVEDTDGR